MDSKSVEKELRNQKSDFNFKFHDAKDNNESIINDEGSIEFSVLTYNVLADNYIKPHYFPSCDKQHLDFKYRSGIIIQEISVLNPDIILMQEVDNISSFYWDALSNLGYQVVYRQRKEKPDSALIAFKLEVFELLWEDFIDFEEGHEFQDNYFKTKNLAKVAVLKHKTTSKKLNVICTHLFWDVKREDIKYLQTFLLLEYMSKNFHPNEAVIWGGDLNSDAFENNMVLSLETKEPAESRMSYSNQKILENEKLIFEKISKLAHIYQFRNMYDTYGQSLGLDDTVYPYFTSFVEDYNGCIDHILYTKSNVSVKKILELPTKSNISTKSLPNGRHPSDHLPVMGIFKML